MALSTAGGAGTGAIPILDLSDGTVAVGTTVILGFDASGNTHQFVLTSEMVTSFAAMEAALTAAPYSFGAGAVDLVPWKHTKIFSMILVVITALIYIMMGTY